jgi:hypothetical protein
MTVAGNVGWTIGYRTNGQYTKSWGMERTSQVIGVYRTFSHLPLEHLGVLDLAAASAPSITTHDLWKWASMASFGSSSGLIEIGV